MSFQLIKRWPLTIGPCYKTSLTNGRIFSVLGITTVLTLSTISLDSRTDLPKVHYATALDWFIICCFGYCIATLLEFAGVHYFTKVRHNFRFFMTQQILYRMFISCSICFGKMTDIRRFLVDKLSCRFKSILMTSIVISYFFSLF